MADYCAICDPDGTIESKYHTVDGKDGWLWVGDHSIVMHDESGYKITGIIPIWFCPYCGRRLVSEEELYGD